jgi:hypothetical protein
MSGYSFYQPQNANPNDGELITLCKILECVSGSTALGTGALAVQNTAATPAGTNSIGNVNPDVSGNGSVTASTPLTVTTFNNSTLGFSANGGATGTITIEGTVDGTNWLPTSYVALASGGISSSFNAATQTIGQINTSGLFAVRFRSNTIVGTVPVYYISSRNVSNVMLDNPLPAGSNVIGGVTLPAASAPVYGQQTSTGTATALPSNTLTSGIVLTNIGTTNAIWVGGSGLTTSNGYSLAAGASVGLVVSNTSSIYILQNTGASTLSFIGS